MLHKLKTNYKDIAKYLPCLDTTISTCAYKKQQLLNMAEKGEDKPSIKTKLGQSLNGYVRKLSKCFDDKFCAKLYSVRPDWLLSQKDVANQKKNELIRLAKNKEKKPNRKTKLGKALSNYLTKSSKNFDDNFCKKIKSIRPDWFVSKTEIANQKKKKLIKIAKNGKDRPKQKTELGLALGLYTRNTSKSFDKKFYSKLQSIRPDWLLSTTEIAIKNKDQLIKIAKSGENKPSKKTKIGQRLRRYTTKSSGSFDDIFFRKIKSIRPDWFLSQTEIANQKKEELIKMAKNGEDRPKQKTKLGRALCNYTGKFGRSFDKKFYENIKSIRPDWFKYAS